MPAPSLKQPSAFIPLVLSLAALALLLSHVALYGIAEQSDESAPARIFQLLLAAQLPVMAWFAIQWLPRSPKRALLILALQLLAALSAIAAVLYFESRLP